MRLTIVALVLLLATACALETNNTDNITSTANETEPDEGYAVPALYEGDSGEGATAKSTPDEALLFGQDNTLLGAQDTPTGGAPIGAPPSSPAGEQPTSPIASSWWLLIPVLAFVVIALVFKLQPGMSLSPEDFGALSAERRMGMLKSLGERRKTLTELSREEGVSLPTAKEHLEKLEKTGFVEKKDEGRKWKYYELTKKGKKLLGSGNN